MKIVKLQLRNIRAFDTLDLSFAAERARPRPWTLLLGDNASGKTTVLRCLAIGMSDESSAAGLVREMKGSMVRRSRGQNYGVILVGLVDSKAQPWTLKTILTPIAKTGDRVRQRIYNLPVDQVSVDSFPAVGDSDPGQVEPEAFAWRKLFVCGYGAARSIDGREEYTDYRMIDAVYTLFRYDQPLQSPELTWRRYRQRMLANRAEGESEGEAIARADAAISGLLADVMDLEGGSLPALREQGIFLPHGRRKIPLADHADGYRSITTWLLDLVAWHFLFRRGVVLKSIGGVVLVDEIEQHLHPRWQRYLVGRLRGQFPDVQFIATTHSALCAASAADLTAPECGITRLAFNPRNQRVDATDISLPYGERADQILMSSAFELADTRNPRVGDPLAEYRGLFRKRNPSRAERARMRELKESLESGSPSYHELNEQARLAASLRALLDEAKRRPGIEELE